MRKILPELKRGDHFVDLVVMNYVGKDKWGKKLYRVRCKCGNVAVVTVSHLRQGDATRCWECKNNARRNNLVGRVFNRAEVIANAGHDIRGNTLSKCLCRCGQEFIVLNNSLLTKNTQSCGCLQRQAVTKHGRARHDALGNHSDATYRIYHGMLSRAENRAGTYPSYADVKVCKRWSGKNGFVHFLADMGERPENTSLSRFKDTGDYKPSNCAWRIWKYQVIEAKKKRELLKKKSPKRLTLRAKLRTA